jgi:hypothetical protein
VGGLSSGLEVPQPSPLTLPSSRAQSRAWECCFPVTSRVLHRGTTPDYAVSTAAISSTHHKQEVSPHGEKIPQTPRPEQITRH